MIPRNSGKSILEAKDGTLGRATTWGRSSKYGTERPRILASVRRVEVRRRSCASLQGHWHIGLPCVSWKQSRPSTGRFLCNAANHALPAANTSWKSANLHQAEDHPIVGWQNFNRANYSIGSEGLPDKNERWENSRSADEKYHPRHPY